MILWYYQVFLRKPWEGRETGWETSIQEKWALHVFSYHGSGGEGFAEGTDVSSLTKETLSFSSASGWLPVNLQKKREEKALDFWNLDQHPRGCKGVWINDPSMGRSSTAQAVDRGALAFHLLLLLWWLLVSTRLLWGLLLPGPPTKLLLGVLLTLCSQEELGLSCSFYQHLPAWHIRTATN